MSWDEAKKLLNSGRGILLVGTWCGYKATDPWLVSELGATEDKELDYDQIVEQLKTMTPDDFISNPNVFLVHPFPGIEFKDLRTQIPPERIVLD